MGALEGSQEELRVSFRELKKMTCELGKDLKTSMGMSADFELALEEGSNFVRIGSAIFK